MTLRKNQEQTLVTVCLHIGFYIIAHFKVVMSNAKESELEKLIKDFVYKCTQEKIELILRDDIILKPVLKRGSTLLGIFWANVFQHKDNFPKEYHKYTKTKDQNTIEETLNLCIPSGKIHIYLTTGTLRISADDVYSWFTRNFKDILGRYDLDLVSTWTYHPTQFERVTVDADCAQMMDTNTRTEDYILLRNTEHKRDDQWEQRLANHFDNLDIAKRQLYGDRVLWDGATLDAKLECLKEGGLFESSSFLCTLYMSLLSRWFSCQDAKVYISSPTIDAKILREIVEIYLSIGPAPKATIDAFYTKLYCDPTNNLSAMEVKKSALQSFTERIKAYAEYHVLRKLTHVGSQLTGSFIAAVHDGNAEVLVASAHLHSSHLLDQNRMETAVFLKMSETDFKKKYNEPCNKPNVSVTY